MAATDITQTGLPNTNQDTSFGKHLPGQKDLVSQYTQNGIQFAQELRSFFKERSQIEKEHAIKLEQLSKKYSSKLDKLGSLVMMTHSAITSNAVANHDNGSRPSTPHGSGNSPTQKSLDSPTKRSIQGQYGTLFQAWSDLLIETDAIAANYMRFSSDLTKKISDPLKSIIVESEALKKQQLSFAQEVEQDFLRSVREKDENKRKYDELCEQTDSTKQKFERAMDEKTAEKLKKTWQTCKNSMINAKHNYILSVEVANSRKNRYYQVDMPTILDRFQYFNEWRSRRLKNLMDIYLNLESEAAIENRVLANGMMEPVKRIDISADFRIFIENHRNDPVASRQPPDFKFEPTLLWRDENRLLVDRQNHLSKTYLLNRLLRHRKELVKCQKQLSETQVQLQGMRKLFNAYSDNMQTGDPEKVYQQMIDTERSLIKLENTQLEHQCIVETIQRVIDPAELQSAHQLVKHKFTFPVQCELCHDKIWALAVYSGLKCKLCGYCCHPKCEMKVPNDCKGNGRADLMGSGSNRQENTEGISSANNLTKYLSSSNLMDISGGVDSGKDEFGQISVGIGADDMGSFDDEFDQDLRKSEPVYNNTEVARVLYSYEAEEEGELTVLEGELVEICQGTDADGWIEVMKSDNPNARGIVPVAYLERESNSINAASNANNNDITLSSESERQRDHGIAKVIFSYKAQQDNEMDILEGEILKVLEMGDDGWWKGEKQSGNVGDFPGSFVELV